MATTTAESIGAILQGQWNELGRKLLELGEALPARAFDRRPAEGVRSAGEVYRHLAFWNLWLAAKARGEDPDGSANELARHEAPTKARALAAFERSVAEAASPLERPVAAAEADTVELYASFLGHGAEHYGQLVVYARLEGIVPPASR